MDNGKRKNNVKGNKRERANKGGRPVKEATEKLKYRVTVKMATEDYYLLKSKAKSAGVSASEFIRGCITEGGVKERLSKADINQVKADVMPFVSNTKELDIWSKEYFLELADMIKFE